MPAIIQDQTLHLIHSKYYYQSPASLPFKPVMYWIAYTDNDIFPITTYGYKDEYTSEKAIKKYITYNTCVLLHEETKEESREYMRRSMTGVRR